jgi:hypothetical protein
MCAHDLFIAGRKKTNRFAGAKRAELTNFRRGHARCISGLQMKIALFAFFHKMKFANWFHFLSATHALPTWRRGAWLKAVAGPAM